VKDYWGNYLYDISDIPFTIERTPQIFTQFRKLMESKGTVGKFLPEPSALKPQGPSVDEQFATDKPTLESMGYDAPPATPPPQPQGATEPTTCNFQGGETAALARLQEYFWDRDLLKVYKETRNGLLGANYSSKFAPW